MFILVLDIVHIDQLLGGDSVSDDRFWATAW
jgi:hypothetical protein